MKTLKLSFDFSDYPDLVELLRLEATKNHKSQKSVLVDALESYFAHRLDTTLLYRAAESVFSDWNNEEDKIYDNICSKRV